MSFLKPDKIYSPDELYREMHLILSAIIHQYGKENPSNSGRYILELKDDSFADLMFDAHTIHGVRFVNSEGNMSYAICLENPPEKKK